MAHLAGTISDPRAGRLVVKLTGTFFQGTYRDAGFPGSSGGAGNILVRAFAGPAGSPMYTEPIDRFAPVSDAEFDYPGGNAVWNVGTAEVAHVNPTSGIWSYGIANLKLVIVLRKK